MTCDAWYFGEPEGCPRSLACLKFLEPAWFMRRAEIMVNPSEQAIGLIEPGVAARHQRFVAAGEATTEGAGPTPEADRRVGMRDDAALLALAADLAVKAGAEICAIRARGFQVRHKPDRSVVTEADHAAEAIIVAGLRDALPECTIVAEEAVASGKVTAATAEFWLVDPLDGTREFAGGGNDFAVNIGLVRDGRAVLGVVGVPATGAVFGGIVGMAAWLQRDRDTFSHFGSVAAVGGVDGRRQ